jgi:hypothetical protein
MQSSNFWHKLNLQRYQIIVFLVVGLLSNVPALAQKTRWVEKNNPNYDQRKISYGFLLGLHSTTYQIKYADAFVTDAFDSLHSINPKWKAGFAIGFIVNRRINDYLDLRLTPTVAFNEHELTYYYNDGTEPKARLVETTMVEFPLLLKYKSERRGNIRMYMIGGVKPSIQASGQKEFEGGETVEMKTSNLSLEAGFGFDLYYPLFKFSPEIRFSHGIVDMLQNRTNPFGAPLRRVNTNTVSVYFIFQ